MSGISEERLAEIERDFGGSLSEMKGTPQHCCHLLIAEIRRLRAENDDLRHLVHRAIPGQFDACGNSYVNSWLEKWLRLAQALGVYRGPLVGNCNELRANWLEANDGGS